MKRVKKLLAVLTVVCFLTSCAGGSPNLVKKYQYGDKERSCEVLTYEIQLAKDVMVEKMEEARNIHNTNMGLAVLGGLLFWYMLAISTSNATFWA